MTATTATPAAAKPQDTAKLTDGARQFEAMMLETMLKPLQFGGAPGDEEDSSGGANDTLRGMGTEAVAKALTTHGGFGLASQIVRQVTHEREALEGSGRGTKV